MENLKKRATLRQKSKSWAFMKNVNPLKSLARCRPGLMFNQYFRTKNPDFKSCPTLAVQVALEMMFNQYFETTRVSAERDIQKRGDAFWMGPTLNSSQWKLMSLHFTNTSTAAIFYNFCFNRGSKCTLISVCCVIKIILISRALWSSKIVAVITQDVGSAIIALFMSTIAYYHRSQTSQYPLNNTYKYIIPEYWTLSVYPSACV